MSDTYHFPLISYVSGGIKVEINLDKQSKQFQEAQQWLGDRILEDCKASMPLLTGSMQQRSYVRYGGKEVVFPGPYARYQYYGKVMVDSQTGKGPRKIPTGPGEYALRFRKGAKLMPTDRPLKYSNPNAVPEWFEHAKNQYKDAWIKGVSEKMGGKK